MQTELDALKTRLYGENSVRNIKFYPGTNNDATPEDMARALNMFFADPSDGEPEEFITKE